MKAFKIEDIEKCTHFSISQKSSIFDDFEAPETKHSKLEVSMHRNQRFRKFPRVIGFTGSPREGGNIEILVEEMFKGASDAGAETKIFNLGK